MKKCTFLLFTAIILATTSCNKDFEKINTNPNSPIQVEPSLLLRQVIYDYGEKMSYEGFVAGNLLGQYFTEIDFNRFDRHSLTEPQFGGNPWPFLYSNLRDNQLILDRSRSSATYSVYEGPALVMKAYLTAALTDIYGDVPYSEALQGKAGNVTPKYDTQELIYTGVNGILDNLDKGISAMKNYSGSCKLQGDILFNGDLMSWIRFANSLKIKYLLRISSKIDVSKQLQELISDDNYIKTNSQNAKFQFTDGQPNNFRLATLRSGDFNLFIMSATAEEIFKELNDPRMAVFYRPTANNPSEFKGLLNGPDPAQTSISVANYSLTGRIFRETTSKLSCNYMTAWETKFLIAEAIERGLVAGNAQEIYNQAVQLSFEYWAVALPTDYLTKGPASYGANGATKIEQIITQKWISNTINGYEGWIEFRRTGFPKLKTISASLNNNLIPVRMPYPTDEAALNQVNYSSAASNTSGNSVNSKVWWDN